MSIDVVGVGMLTVDDLLLVDERPDFGASQRVRQRLRQCGGPAANAMATLARLGVPTRLVARVGDDAEGDFLCREMAALHVDVGAVQRAHGTSRVITVLVDAASGERGFIVAPESFEPLGAGDMDAASLAGARIVHVDDADEAGLAAAHLAADAGQRVVFDGTWQSEHLDAFLPLVDTAIVSAFFARRWMPGAGDDDVVQALLDSGATTAVLTLGADGSLGRSAAGERVVCAACPIDVVDTTGAGDAYHGGYIYGMLQGWPLERTMRFAAATGALNCRRLGGQSGLPTIDEVTGYLASL